MGKSAEKPKKINLWDRQPWPSRGSKSLTKMYAAVGQTLSQWEWLEQALMRVYAALVTADESLPAQRSYNAVRTFEGRASMLEAASLAYFALWPEDALLARFKDVYNAAKRYSPRRNDIAHGLIGHFTTEASWRPKWGSKPLKSYALYPSYANFKDRTLEGKPEYCFTVPTMEHYRVQFHRIAQQAQFVSAHLIGNRRTQQAISERELRERVRAYAKSVQSQNGQQ